MAKIKREQLSGKLLDIYDKIQSQLKSDDDVIVQKAKTAEKKFEDKIAELKAKKDKLAKEGKLKDKKKTTKPKAKSKKKTSTKKDSKPKQKPFMTRVKEYAEKNNMAFVDARKELSKKIKEEEKEERQEAEKQLDKLLKTARSSTTSDINYQPSVKKSTFKPKAGQTTSKSSDAKRQAKPAGKRKSKSGKTYYEYRENRSDRNSVPTKKGYKYKGKTPPFLEKGGMLTARENLTENDIQKLSQDFEVFNDRVETLDDGKVVGTFNSKGHLVLKPKTLKNPLVKWLKENSFTTTEEAEKLAKGGKLSSHGLQKGDKVLRTILGNVQEVADKDGNLVYVDLEDGYRDAMPPLPFEKGGRIISVVNEGETYDEDKYDAIFSDYDNDGVVNINDVSPLDSSVSGRVEQVKLDQTFRKLIDVKNKLDSKMNKAIDKLDKKVPKDAEIYARTKTPFSIVKKLVDKRLLDPNKGLTDLIGTTVVVDNQKQLESLKKELQKGLMGKVLDFDDFYKNPKAGYRAYHFIVEYEGTPIEIQLKTKMQKQLNEVSHEFYKKGNLDGKGLNEVSKMIMEADKGDKKALKEAKELLSNQQELAEKISTGKMAKGGELSENEKLPYELDKFFKDSDDAIEVPLNLLEPSGAREKGIANAEKFMRLAYNGEKDRRKPITIAPAKNGMFEIVDGNSTYAVAKKNGWKTILADLELPFEKGGEVNKGYYVSWLEDGQTNVEKFESNELDVAKDFFNEIKLEKFNYQKPKIVLTTVDDEEVIMGKKFEKGGEIDAFVMNYVKGVPNTNLRLDTDKFEAQLEKGGLLKNSKYISREEIEAINLKNGKRIENDYADMQFLSGAYISDKVITESEVDESQYSLFEEGGKLPKDAIYIKRRDIESIELNDYDNDDTEIVEGKFLVNGFWIDPKKQSRLKEEAIKEGRIKKTSKKMAKGGKTKKRPKSALMRDRKYYNKDESWERQYSKGKNRKGYNTKEKGGTVTKSNRPNPMSLAKKIRKKGEKWTDAVSRASKMMRDKK